MDVHPYAWVRVCRKGDRLLSSGVDEPRSWGWHSGSLVARTTYNKFEDDSRKTKTCTRWRQPLVLNSSGVSFVFHIFSVVYWYVHYKVDLFCYFGETLELVSWKTAKYARFRDYGRFVQPSGHIRTTKTLRPDHHHARLNYYNQSADLRTVEKKF